MSHIILQSYFYNRSFQVRTPSSSYTPHPISSGVPQGSNLGPVLYIMYTAHIPIRTHISIYDHGTVIFSPSPNLKNTSHQLQEHLESAEEWCKKQTVKVNPAKCCHKRSLCQAVNTCNQQLPGDNELRTIKYIFKVESVKIVKLLPSILCLYFIFIANVHPLQKPWCILQTSNLYEFIIIISNYLQY